jgi:hypothetical protein
MLRQIEGQLGQGMSLTLACKDAGICEQSRDGSLARPRQSGAAAFILGRSTDRPCGRALSRLERDPSGMNRVGVPKQLGE